MPVYPGRRKGTYRVTVWAHGQQHEWIVEGRKKDASLFEGRKRSELSAHSRAAVRAVPTFVDFSNNVYEPHARARLGPNTWARARRYVVSYLAEHFGPTRLDALQASDVESYTRQRIARGLVPGSINNELAILRTMLKWGREVMGYPIPSLPIRYLKTDKPRRVRAWTAEEVATLYEAMAADCPALVPIVQFMLNTGVRKGEAIAAEWSWVDWGAKMLRIPVTAYWKPKDREAREVPLDGLLSMLHRQPRTGRYVFPSERGTRFSDFPHKPFNRAVKAAGLTGGPHTTRHTFASHFLQARPDLGLLAAVLGHSHTKVTQIYAHMLPGHLEQARGAVDLSPEPWRPTLAAAGGSSKARPNRR